MKRRTLGRKTVQLLILVVFWQAIAGCSSMLYKSIRENAKVIQNPYQLTLDDSKAYSIIWTDIDSKITRINSDYFSPPIHSVYLSAGNHDINFELSWIRNAVLIQANARMQVAVESGKNYLLYNYYLRNERMFQYALIELPHDVTCKYIEPDNPLSVHIWTETRCEGPGGIYEIDAANVKWRKTAVSKTMTF